MAGPAYFDAFRRITVQPDSVTVTADAVNDQLTLTAGTWKSFGYISER